MIEVEGLRKQFGDLVAVRDASFVALPGKIFGLLGPNGAGKSTTIGCISGLLQPSAGHIRILGHDVVTDGQDSRRQLGVMPQELALYDDLSATENLSFWGAAYGMRGKALKDRALEVLEFVALQDRAKEPVKNFSGGMMRRLNYGCAIMHRPQVLLLDEPTSSLDDNACKMIEELLAEVKKECTILLVSHYLDQVKRIADTGLRLFQGQMIQEW